MAQPMSPLSTISANATPAIERKASCKITKSKPNDQDAENTSPQSPEQPPSSPFVEDVVYSPAKRRTLSSTLSPAKKQPQPYESVPLTEQALRENEGFVKQPGSPAKSTSGSIYEDGAKDTIPAMDEPAGYPGMDDTRFTAFSAVPDTDMTTFARLGQSPLKNNIPSPTKSARKGFSEDTPRRTQPTTSASRRHQSFEDNSPSPTPRRPKSSHGDTTNLLVDFTEQFNAFATNTRYTRPSPKKSQTQPNLAQYTNGLRTPSPAKHALPPGTPSEAQQLANLLDFDLPPAPTPRSIPTITARELESLKSSFLSQISSLRATLNGKEAEVASFREAVTDAERRVGEAMEELREERGTRESLQAGKLDWEKRDKEMQDVLRGVKEEIMRESREKEQLRQNLEDSERKREEAEARAIDAESKLVGLQTPSNAGSAGQGDSRKEVDAAVERVAQELHGLYKTKHEDKVKALKKSYQARWEKKIHDLESKLDEVCRENEELRLGRDATMSGLVPSVLASANAENEAQTRRREQERAAEAQRYETQAAKLKGLEAEIQSVKSDNKGLLQQLEAERVEMSELVAATEEMMQLQTSQSTSHDKSSTSTGMSDSLRAPFSRSLSSGLKAPTAGHGGESRIGRMNAGANGSDVRPRSGSGAGRSGIMRNIERMGSHRGGVGE
jgi:hypothetical protein